MPAQRKARRSQSPKFLPEACFSREQGPHFHAPLYKKWFAAYHQAHPQIVIAYDSVGSGEGMRRFIGRDVTDEDQVDFGASDAALRDDQIAQVAGGVVMLPVTAGGVVLAYNLPGITQDLNSRGGPMPVFSWGRLKPGTIR